ncbi:MULTISPECIES: protocatechuate 3,4-dioxygenase [unclassified Burkholderia]|uniref:DODA-type extradiol aromatic ring-opening family dioxygenase n=1 Tax=unclassified Burkholderia TaxID=2613784 RepID=UPI000F5AD9A1|nr:MULTISPECIES: protocatechuate 3,4-dioxygenase [unclassified Burkholderia]RQS24200.1 protocatechuate 3,4-dioxygenase [Burkholderia sp. Bp8995]RQS37924.1 protocatechuate 3,4-dioxygenase [Burkholderia sp. Bp8989]
MGKIVGAFLVPHDPVMYVAPDAPPKEQRDAVWGAYRECAERLKALEPTTVVIVGCDHYILFGPQCLPSYLIATGDVDGPIDQLPGLKRGVFKNNEALAIHIASHGRENGFDWTVARAFTVDHSVAIPQQLIVDPLRADGIDVKTIPVYLACGVDPYITMRRASELGEQIRKSVEVCDDGERVVIIGSGGISHWVGSAQMGRVDEMFDRKIIGYTERGDLDGMCALSDGYILECGGEGAMEIRNWACAMGALKGARGELIAYEAVPEWVTGLGFMQLHPK